MTRVARRRSRGRRAWAALVVIVVGLAATALLADVVGRLLHSAKAERFGDLVERAVATLESRLARHRASSSAAAAVLGAERGDDWPELDRLVATATREQPAPSRILWCERRADGGCRVLAEWSASADASVHAVEDFESAMARASASRRAELALLPRSQGGPATDVAFVFPVLGPADWVQPSTAMVQRHLITVFRSSELIGDALRPSSEWLRVVVRDRTDPNGVTLYDGGESVGRSSFHATHWLEAGGRRLELEFHSKPSLERKEGLVRLVWLGGLMLTALFTALTWSESRARSRAERMGRQLEAADHELRRANRAKDHFLALLGHELRNPLGTIANALKIVRIQNPGQPVVLRALDVAERQVELQAGLVDDLLDLTRLAAGQVHLSRELIDLRDVTKRSVTDVHPRIREAGLSLELVLPETGVFVWADVHRVEQAVGKLLSNAARYTPRGGSIRVSVERLAGQAVLAVKDTGVGIDAKDLATLFTPFVQRPAGRSQQSGLGVGLSIAERLVQLHGGSLAAHSAGPGRGSELRLRLPLAREVEAAERATVARAPRPEERGAALDVLIVEDIPDSREMLTELVGMYGHRVRAAESGAGALEAASAKMPDLAFVDVGLPDMNGLEVARAIRVLPDGGHARLVALTGFGSPELRGQSLDAGFDEYLVKPLSLERLAELLSGSRGDLAPKSSAVRSAGRSAPPPP